MECHPSVCGCTYCRTVRLRGSRSASIHCDEDKLVHGTGISELRLLGWQLGRVRRRQSEQESRAQPRRSHTRRLRPTRGLREHGEHGQSFTIYDASRKVWHQTWVTNQGVLLVIEGGMHGNEIVLSGRDRTTDGKTRYVRGTWKPVSGGVREVAVTSIDGGKTWTPWFDIIFRPSSEKPR
jgi:hypothetical protein